ncbi:MAG: nucleoside-diphosphate sugar epimerase [Anaerolineales bacterium]|nr:MAG: nucleoside-diphosphate sugar epimerase [Anaerolineales bacterium]
MILVSGAGGKTGLALLRQLAHKGISARALVRREEQVEQAVACGAAEARVGDLLDPRSMAPAFQGLAAVYHIPPNMHPQEEAIAENVLHLAKESAAGHFVYHSVLRPYIRAMPHHINKARVEERLYAANLPFTIVQPAAYMQNTLPGLRSAGEEGVYRVPYPIETRLGMVDLEEVAEVAASIIANPAHFGATYELAGSEVLTPFQVAEQMSAALGKPIRASEIELEAWKDQAAQSGLSRYSIETLLKMFRYYAEHGFWGNPHTLTTLLGRPPKTYAQFLASQDLAPFRAKDDGSS